jgi:hypothetical protein
MISLQPKSTDVHQPSLNTYSYAAHTFNHVEDLSISYQTAAELIVIIEMQ